MNDNGDLPPWPVRTPEQMEEDRLEREYQRLAPHMERLIERHRQLEDPRRQKALDAVHRLSRVQTDQANPINSTWFWHDLADILHWLIVK